MRRLRQLAATPAVAPVLLLTALAACSARVDVAETPGDVGATETREPLALRRDYAIPPDTVLLEQLEEAIELRARDDIDRLLDAREPGELLEHATLTQTALDRGIFGPDALFVFGDELFDYAFRPEQGLGNGLAGRPGVAAGSAPAPNLRRVHAGEFGGPDSHDCSSCHLQGGLDGSGRRTQNAYLRGDGDSTVSADERNPPHLLGLGPVAALAREMSLDLARQRDAGLDEAKRSSRDVRVPLVTKGVDFGLLVARPDGSVDVSGVVGVDPDLVVRPFGWKGHRATLPEMVEESFRIHMGILSARDQRAVRETPDAERLGDGPWFDVDRDGTSQEVESGMVTSMAAYLAQLEAPVIRPPEGEGLLALFARGGELFYAVGCASCHRPILVLDDPILPIRPLDPALADVPPVLIDVAQDGEGPKIELRQLFGQSRDVRLFSDLKRHDMGPGLATPTDHAGVPPSVFLTRPLWGLASTSPYLHDGRAPTIDAAIRLHGGEALDARRRYVALPAADRAAISVFLLSLDRTPKLMVP